MKKIWTAPLTTLMLLLPVACGKIYNSTSNDASAYGPPTGNTGTPEFIAAKAIIDAKCSNCHSPANYHANFSGWTEADFVSNNKVSPNNLAGSVLYTRLIGNRLGVGAQNMPDGGPGLTSDELNTIEAWIGSIPL